MRDMAAILDNELKKAKRRNAKRQRDRKAMRDLAEAAKAAGVDDDEDRVRQRGEFSRLCRDLAKLPEPSAFIERHSTYLTDRHVALAREAHAWLSDFLSSEDPR